ncbi:MAG: PAS domain S-box protein [Gammaproteobacteria bacterium]|nr:MAG: PAS domain S-box protein [Gammaproteobacteria bacterium]
MRKDKDTRHDPADADELVRLTEELERRNAALEAQVREQDRNRVALLHLLEDLEHEHKQVEQARREWTLAFDAIHDPVFLHNADYRIVRANRAYAARAGLPFKDLIGKPYWEVFPRGAGPLPSCRRAMSQAEETEAAEEVRLDTGEIFLSRSFGVRDAQGAYLYSVHVLENVTERHKSEQALRESEERFRRLFEHSNDAIFIHTLTGELLDANAQAERLLGYPLDVLKTIPVTQYSPPEDAELGRRAFEETRTKGHVRFESHFRHANGNLIDVEISSRIVDSAKGIVQGVVRDITARKRAEEALRDEKLFSDETIESLPGVFYLFDTGGRFVRWNRSLEIVSGYSHDEIGSMHPADLFTGADRQHIVERIAEVFEKGESTAEAAFTAKDGRRIPFFFTGRRVELAGTVYLVGMGIDISARTRAEVALRQSEEKFRSLVETTSDWIWEVDRDGRYTYISPKVETLLGYRPEEMLGKSPFDFMAPEEAKRVRGVFGQAIAARAPFTSLENINLRKDGRRVLLESSGIPFFDTSGNFAGYRGIDRDVTGRKEAETRVRSERDRAQRYLDIAGVMLVALDSKGNVTLINRKGCEMLGYPETEIVGQSWFDRFLPEQSRKDARKIFEQVLAGESRLTEFYENPVLVRDGTERVIAWHNRILTDDTGRPVGTLSSGEDITERKWAEMALHRSNRALKTLSACNAALVHAQSESELLRQICHVIVETGAYAYAWIGYAAGDGERRIRPMAQDGFEPGVLEARPWPVQSQDPCSTAVREGMVVVARDTANDPALAERRDMIEQLGIGSIAAFPLMSGDEAFGMLSIYSRERDAFNPSELNLLAEMAEDLNFGVLTLRARTEHQQLQEEHLKTAERLKETLSDTIRAIALTVEKRDPYTAGHQNKVADLCVAIGRELKLPEDRIEGLRLGATIHDIGKVYVPAEILNRPGKLSDAEFEIIKSHPDVGYEIIKDVKFPWPVAETVRQHHEHLDGSGYPRGLRGEAIILEARILAVADVVEAMASHRPYRSALGIEAALTEIERHRGDWYDPAVVDACLRLFREKRFAFG